MRAQSSSNSALSLGSGNVAAKTILKAWHGGTAVSRNFYYFFIAMPPATETAGSDCLKQHQNTSQMPVNKTSLPEAERPLPS